MTSNSRLGVGLRSPHYLDILSGKDVFVDWFEAISENYMDSFGRPRKVLKQIRCSYDIALHGVSLNIGSVDPLNFDYLKKLKALSEEIEPFIISDHCCWTGIEGFNGHELYPLPYTKEALEVVVIKIQKIQEFLGRQILIENVSTYLQFAENEFTEWDFLNNIVKKSGCGLLLDLNNIFVNAFNHQFEPLQFLKGIDLQSVGQIHLAGFTNKGDYYFDTHSSPVVEGVWSLYKEFLSKGYKAPVLLEWDEDMPSFQTLQNEVLKAKDIEKSVESV